MTSPTHRGPSATLLLAGLALVGAVALIHAGLRRNGEQLTEIRQRLDLLASETEAQRHALQLLRFEQRSKAGLGMAALLDQLGFWGVQMDHASTPQVERGPIGERLEAILEAMQHLGADRAMPELERDFAAVDPVDGQSRRNWVMRAMARLDTPRGRDFLAETTLGFERVVTNRTRLFAAGQLRQLDAPRCAAVLRDILSWESARGVDPRRMPEAMRERYGAALTRFGTNQAFYNFVDAYVACEDPAAAETLLMVLGRDREHDLLTLQQCIKALGHLGARNAAPAIRKLFEAPPPTHHPMFRNHCLDALAAIEGDEARTYFREALRNEKVELVRAKLTDLIQRTNS